MNICLVSVAGPIARALTRAGHAVLALSPRVGRVFDLAAAMAERGFTPELVVQQEHLAERILLAGLPDIPCPKLFWAIDPHLNAFWQSAYGRLFDAVLSTQNRWLPELARRGAKALRLPWFGQVCEWKPFNRRSHDIAFVGRVTPQRPARQWFIDLLCARFPGRVRLARDVSFGELIELYRDTRLAPNEAIFGEVNFRLFEAASAGSLVLNPDLPGELDDLFEPGVEVEVFAEAAELAAQIARLLDDPHRAKAVARAGFERVRASHLPEHRAARILEIAREAGGSAATGPQAEVWFWLSAFLLWEAARLPLDPGLIGRGLSALAPDPLALAALLRLLVATGRRDEARARLTAILAAPQAEESLELDLAGSMAALELGLPEQARQFWLRWLKRGADGRAPAEVPAEPKRLLTLWARELRRAGLCLRAGFPFDARAHLPASAAECLLRILKDEPEELAVLRELDGLLSGLRGAEQSRVGLLSIVTLHERRDWRLALEIGLCDLRSFRLEEGLEELRIALALAEEAGQAKAFLRVLAARDPRGCVRAALGGGKD